jgi:hypothetical protein
MRPLFGISRAFPSIPHLHRSRRLFIAASSAGGKFARSLCRPTGVGDSRPFRSTIQSLCFQRSGDDICVGQFRRGSIRHDRLPGLGGGFARCRTRRGGCWPGLRNGPDLPRRILEMDDQKLVVVRLGLSISAHHEREASACLTLPAADIRIDCIARSRRPCRENEKLDSTSAKGR